METDPELVARARGGDALAFEALVERYQPAVESVALGRLRSFADAQDAVQETFVRAYESLGSLHDPERFGHWLLVVARNVALSRRKRGEARLEVPLDGLAEHAGATEPAEQRAEPGGALGEAMDELAPDDRAMLLLHYFDMVPVARISELLALPEGSVKRKLHETRGRLRGILEAAGVKVKLAQSAQERRQEIMNSAPVVKYLNLLLLTAVKEKASRITIDPGAPGAQEAAILLEVNGTESEIPPPPPGVAQGVCERARTMCFDALGKAVQISCGGVSYTLQLVEKEPRVVLTIAAA